MGPLGRAIKFWREQWWPGWRRERLRWRVKSDFSREQIEVFYGHENVPGREELVTGGLVKVQDLIGQFPSNTHSADLVYLISSALPHFTSGFAGLLLPTKASLLAKHAIHNKRPIILNQNGVAYPAWCPTGWKRVNRTNRDIMQKANYVIYQSEFCRQTAERFLRVKPKAWEVLHNPVNTKLLIPAENKKHDSWQLLVTGSHWEFYRIECAVRTLAELQKLGYHDIVLNVAGEYCWGQSKEVSEKRIVKLAIELGVSDQLVFLGSYTQEEVVALFARVHVMLHTKYNDPCPRSVIESMSCGVPVVYSASGGVTELVGAEAGFGVPAPQDWLQNHPPEAKEMARGVEKIFMDYQLYSAGARLCAVENFDVASWLKRHNEIFQEILRDS